MVIYRVISFKITSRSLKISFLYDNAKLRTVGFTQWPYSRNSVLRFCHIPSPYSSDLLLSDFQLFLTLKKGMTQPKVCIWWGGDLRLYVHFLAVVRSWIFENNIKQKWTERQERCIKHAGKYFEEDRDVE